jgi:hypothetical protein
MKRGLGRPPSPSQFAGRVKASGIEPLMPDFMVADLHELVPQP